ncbi:MFS transporter [Microbacterium sp. Root61]|uniref:MFS transporter n=1 Tax=Microbacterium sp. Root61 TaxID=1736570 RepID=UPI0006F8DA3D|nr:MFS transporter [Microbacterium sp. Root61]KRA24557.1 MFS transporter [Microbacterium sp. Root61]
MTNVTVNNQESTPLRRAGGWQAVLLLAGSCMPVLGSVLITPVLPQLSAHFADVPASEILVPMIVAIPALIIAIFAPFAGQIVDRLGRKTLLIIAMFAYAVVGTAPAWLEGLPEILLSRVLVGVCEAAIMTVCTTLIVDYFHEERRRNKYLGLQTVTTTLAATVFIILGGALGVGGWHTPFWVYAVSIVIAVPMIFSLWEPTPAEAGDTRVETVAKTRIPWRRIAVPLVVTLFGGFTFYVIIIEASYLVVGTGVAATDTATIGLVAAIASLATAIGGLIFARLRRLRAGSLTPVAFALQAIGMLVIWVVPGLAGIIIGAVIASFGAGLLLPSLVTWVVATTTFEDRGRVTGWWTAAFFLGQFLTPILMGAIGAGVGGLSAAVGIVGIAAGVVAVLVWFATRRKGAPVAAA